MNTFELLDKTYISYFRRANSPVTYKNITLRKWLSNYSNFYRAQILSIREMSKQDEKRAKEMKKDLPCVTIGAQLDKYRSSNHIKEINPIICIDIDRQDNEHIEDWEQLKRDVFKIDGVFFSSLSCRGNGIYCLVYYDKTKDPKSVFRALIKDFKQLNINIDESTKDIFTRLRFCSYDENMMIKETVNIYDKTLDQPEQQIIYKEQSHELGFSDEFTMKAIYYLIVELKYRANDYLTWLTDGFRLATFGIYGSLLFTLLSKLSNNYDAEACSNKWNECVSKTSFKKSCLAYYFKILKNKLGKDWVKTIEDYHI